MKDRFTEIDAEGDDGAHPFGALFPKLDRADRLALAESLTEGSHWNINFAVMLGVSVLIAGLGLIQNSVAVIVGAMLVAPLMTPLIGIGLALVQGNFKLLRGAVRAMVLGSVMCLVLGISVRLIIPGHELTISESVWFKLHDRVDREEGIDFLTGVRASSDLPEDIILVISADRPVPIELLTELDQIIDDEIGEDLKVKINVVQQGQVLTPIKPGSPEKESSGSDSAPAIND